MTVSLCKHSFPVQPPHGSLGEPGDCTGCGLTWDAAQAQLEAQAAALRAGTAHEGACHGCHLHRLLFRYDRQQQPWEQEQPLTLWFCTPCWSDAKQSEETTGFVDFNDVFDRGSDDQLAAYVGGRR